MLEAYAVDALQLNVVARVDSYDQSTVSTPESSLHGDCQRHCRFRLYPLAPLAVFPTRVHVGALAQPRFDRR